MIRQQKTIETPFTIEGHGLHTGNAVTLNIKPAPANTGIRFIRSDLKDRVELDATIDSVSANTPRNTTIGTDRR